MALRTLKLYLFSYTRAIAALVVALGLAGCARGEFGASLRSSTAVQSYRGGEIPGTLSRLEAAVIRYSQATYSLYGEIDDGDLYKVEDNVQWLKDHPDQDLPWGGPIRVFRKQASMDEWGPLSEGGFTGDPKNLDNGEIYTLDHRRLVAYRMAGRKTIPVEWADLEVVKNNRWKFTTNNGGRRIAPNP